MELSAASLAMAIASGQRSHFGAFIFSNQQSSISHLSACCYCLERVGNAAACMFSAALDQEDRNCTNGFVPMLDFSSRQRRCWRVKGNTARPM